MEALSHEVAAAVPALRAIVKLGGSLARDTALPRWLSAIATAAEPRLVVPGGGPFADTVRTLQPHLGFDDRVAHGAAILAMQQYALVLAALEPRLVPDETEPEIVEVAAGGRSGIWLPWSMVGRDPTIEASWRITSDSLALLIATRLSVPELLLVKAAVLLEAPVELETLAERGILDEAFPGLARGYPGRIRLAHLSEFDALAKGGCEPRRVGLSNEDALATLGRAG